MSGSVPQPTASQTDGTLLEGYYGVPVIHRPHWKWLVIGYFYLGGISGSTAAISAIARLVGGERGKSVSRLAAFVSIAAFAPCPPLLILDLGRPARFLNMLRVFRRNSPMSVGSWALAIFGAVNSLHALWHFLQIDTRSSQMTQPPSDDRLPPRPAEIPQSESLQEKIPVLGDTLAAINGAFGFLVAGYTGVLLAATAVPLWSKRPVYLGPLFLASAMSSGTAAVTLAAVVSGALDKPSEDRLQQLEAASTIAKGVTLAAWLVSLGATARPLTSGQLGQVVRHLAVGAGMVAPLAMMGSRARLPRAAQPAVAGVAAALTLAGSLALRYAVVEGGRISADDPQATFEMTR